jgi:hypothetical protein
MLRDLRLRLRHVLGTREARCTVGTWMHGKYLRRSRRVESESSFVDLSPAAMRSSAS